MSGVRKSAGGFREHQFGMIHPARADSGAVDTGTEAIDSQVDAGTLACDGQCEPIVLATTDGAFEQNRSAKWTRIRHIPRREWRGRAGGRHDRWDTRDVCRRAGSSVRHRGRRPSRLLGRHEWQDLLLPGHGMRFLSEHRCERRRVSDAAVGLGNRLHLALLERHSAGSCGARVRAASEIQSSSRTVPRSASQSTPARSISQTLPDPDDAPTKAGVDACPLAGCGNSPTALADAQQGPRKVALFDGQSTGSTRAGRQS